MSIFQSILDWFLSLGAQYGVNPWIFGGIYVGAIPLFAYFSSQIVSHARAGKSVIIPPLLAGLCFVSVYIYLIIAGQNVPIWVYGFIVLLVVGGGWSAYRKITTQIDE